MSRDDIIKLAREAGYFLYDLTETHNKRTVETDDDDEWAVLERFAALVAAAEREACAQVCDAVQKQNEDVGAWHWEAKLCAAAIRARGQE